MVYSLAVSTPLRCFRLTVTGHFLRYWEKETGVDWTEDNLREAVAEIRRVYNVHPFPDEVGTPVAGRSK